MTEIIDNQNRLLRRIQREKRARKDLESVIEKRNRELWEANQKLENTLENLEHIVDERTFELKREVEFRNSAESRLRLILNSTLEGIIGIDQSGNVSFINQAAKRILQCSGTGSCRCAGKTFADVFPLVDKYGKSLGDNHLYSVWFRHQHISSSEEFLKLKDGSSIAIEYSMKHAMSDDVFQGAVLTFSDISKRRELEEQVWKQANFDSRTGIPNRYLLKDRMHEAIIQTSRTKKKIGLLYIDLNDFKLINDELGHDAGDLVLKITVERLSKIIRHSDFVARIGGDEFIVVLTNIDKTTDLQEIIEGVKATQRPISIGHNTRMVTMAIGSALFPDNGLTLEVLMKHADKRMYKEKSRMKLN